MKDFSKLEEKLGIKFKDKGLLKQAFCHRSFVNENDDFKRGHNERLEFLGDAVLELVVTEYLFHSYSDKPEGELTNWRAALVNTKTLGELARELDFDDFILLSKGEKKEKGKSRIGILCDVFEAFLGAVYLDRGYEEAKKFIEKNLIPKTDEIMKKGLLKDPKSLFQEKAQEEEALTPEYKVLNEWGPDHAKHFLCGLFIGEELVAKGEGSSKQEAEERAAQRGLQKKNWEIKK